MSGQQVDVAIVGAGPAGVATAYHLRDSGVRTTVFEAAEEVGGRTRSRLLAGEAVNTGAMFVYRDTPTHALAEELGIRLEPFHPASFGVHLAGTTVVSRDTADLVARLPLSQTERSALSGFFADALAAYRANTVEGRLTSDSAALAEVRADAQLAGLPPRVRAILQAAIQGGSVARPEQLSARYALRYFASYLAHEQNNRLLALDGMQAIVRGLADRLAPGTLRTGTRVSGVRREAGRWLLDVAGHPTPVRARQVVLAVPAPQIDQLCSLPDWKRQALQRVATPGSTTLAVVADISGLHVAPATAADLTGQIDDWAFVATPGRLFDVIINPRPGRRDGRLQVLCYGNSAGFLPDLDANRESLTRRWLDDLLAVAPALRGRIRGAHLQTWPHCFSLLTPERAAVLSDLQRSVDGTLHVAGDFSSETAGTHGAFAEAARVAAEVSCRGPRNPTGVLTGRPDTNAR